MRRPFTLSDLVKILRLLTLGISDLQRTFKPASLGFQEGLAGKHASFI